MGHGTAIGTALRGDISKLRRCRAPSLRSLGRTPRDEMIAAHCDACSWACSNTIRTTRSRTFGKNLLGLAMPHPLKEWSRILQLATGLVTLRLAKRQRGAVAPFAPEPLHGEPRIISSAGAGAGNPLRASPIRKDSALRVRERVGERPHEPGHCCEGR